MNDLGYQRTILAYHGCDRSVAKRVLAGGAFRVSDNDYDWLGQGVYFWEYGPARALHWAEEEHKRSPRKVAHPASVGAIVHLGRCFDLLDTRNTSLLSALYPKFCAAFLNTGKAIPENRGNPSNAADLVLRRLDCAVINWALPQLEQDLKTKFQTVRGVFTEGPAAFAGSCIMARSHIQIAVRDSSCIVGVFEPRT